MKDMKDNLKKIRDLLNEAERYEKLKQEFLRKQHTLFSAYQQGRYSYFQYKKLLEQLLRGKSKEEWVKYYNSYIYSLLKRIEMLNYKIFYSAYKDKSKAELRINAKPAAAPAAVVIPKKTVVPSEKPAIPLKPISHPVKKVAPPIAARPSHADVIRQAVKKETPIEAEKRQLRKHLRVDEVPVPPVFEKGAVKQERKEYVSTKEFVFGIVKRMFGVKEVTYLGKEKEISIPRETLSIRKKRIVKEREVEPIPTAIAEEAERIKKIMEGRSELKVYKPSFLGSISNIAVKKLSYFFITKFPDVFRYLYNALRLANIQMLSNTYVNIMILVSVLSSTLSLIVFFLFFLAIGNPIGMVIGKTIFMTILAVALTIVTFYAYPFAKIKSRRRSIKANLPFAVNHMAAVASSGVSPSRMFALIARSKEYGEITTEMEKVVEFIEIFGYDFVTALRSIASTTPSPDFKDFLDGMVSSIESGSDLKAYMGEKSREAMGNYELERKKFTETVSTYSDVYTGLLIAAPLFFVAALSLVSLLGGAIGGIAVNTLMVLGTYLVIPLLNVLFLVFLEITQPEI